MPPPCPHLHTITSPSLLLELAFPSPNPTQELSYHSHTLLSAPPSFVPSSRSLLYHSTFLPPDPRASLFFSFFFDFPSHNPASLPPNPLAFFSLASSPGQGVSNSESHLPKKRKKEKNTGGGGESAPSSRRSYRSVRGRPLPCR